MERANMAHHDPCSGEEIENSVTESEYYVWNRSRDDCWFVLRGFRTLLFRVRFMVVQQH